MSRPDTSIYQTIKPIAVPDPLQQAGKVLSIQQMIQQSKTEGLQQQNLQQQIQQRQQANAEEQKAAEVYRRTMDSLPPDTKPEARDQALVDAYNREGLTKYAAAHVKTQAEIRKSINEADEAELKRTHQEVENKIQQADLYGRNWMQMAANPDPQAFQYYVQQFVQAGMLDPKDPTIPDPQTATPEQIKVFAQSHAMGGMNTKDALAHIREVTNDAIENKRKQAETARAEEETKKTKAEIEGTLPTEEERNFKAQYPGIKEEFAASHKGRPPTDSEARAIFKERQAKAQGTTDLQREMKMFHDDPETYAKFKGRGQKEIRDDQRFQARMKTMDLAKDLPRSQQEQFFESQRNVYQKTYGIDIGPYSDASATPKPKAGQSAKKADLEAAGARAVPPLSPADAVKKWTDAGGTVIP